MRRMPAQDRRELLLQAAWRVLARSGMAAATTRAICAEAGMPQASFHYCFASRDALLREVVGSLLPQELAAVQAAIDGQGSLDQAVHQALMGFWDLVEADPGAHQVLLEITCTAVRDPLTADLARTQYQRYLATAAEAIDEITRVLGVAWDLPVALLARQVVSILDGVTLQYLVDRDGTAARATLSRFAVDLARHGAAHPVVAGAGR